VAPEIVAKFAGAQYAFFNCSGSRFNALAADAGQNHGVLQGRKLRG